MRTWPALMLPSIMLLASQQHFNEWGCACVWGIICPCQYADSSSVIDTQPHWETGNVGGGANLNCAPLKIPLLDSLDY